MSKKLMAAVAFTALVLMPAGARGAGEQPVATGDYEGQAKIDRDTLSVADFAVAKDGGKRKIVPATGLSGIYYPDAAECDPYSVPLSAASVPISKSARFRVKDEYPIPEGGTVKVDWKGRWTSAKRVKGTIKISFDGCTDTHDWKGARTG